MMWLLCVSVAGCVALHFAKRDTATETMAAVTALAPLFAVLVVALT